MSKARIIARAILDTPPGDGNEHMRLLAEAVIAGDERQASTKANRRRAGQQIAAKRRADGHESPLKARADAIRAEQLAEGFIPLAEFARQVTETWGVGKQTVWKRALAAGTARQVGRGTGASLRFVRADWTPLAED